MKSKRPAPSSGSLKRRRVGTGRAAKVLAAAEARSNAQIKKLSESGVVASKRPSDSSLEIGATAQAIACDNQNITKKAGKGKARHLFVLPGHLDLLKFASSTRANKSSKQSGTAQRPKTAGAVAAAKVDAAGSQGASSKAKADDGPLSTNSPNAPTAQEMRIARDSFGAVAELGSGKPVLYIDVPAHAGRIMLRGTIVYPDAPLLTLQLPPASSKNKSIVCDNVFDNMVVFDNMTWVPNEPSAAGAAPASAKPEPDKIDLQKERDTFSSRRLQQGLGKGQAHQSS
eukprot:g268.t1